MFPSLHLKMSKHLAFRGFSLLTLHDKSHSFQKGLHLRKHDPDCALGVVIYWIRIVWGVRETPFAKCFSLFEKWFPFLRSGAGGELFLGCCRQKPLNAHWSSWCSFLLGIQAALAVLECWCQDSGSPRAKPCIPKLTNGRWQVSTPPTVPIRIWRESAGDD